MIQLSLKPNSTVPNKLTCVVLTRIYNLISLYGVRTFESLNSVNKLPILNNSVTSSFVTMSSWPFLTDSPLSLTSFQHVCLHSPRVKGTRSLIYSTLRLQSLTPLLHTVYLWENDLGFSLEIIL